MNLPAMPPPREDPPTFSHAVVVLTVVLAASILTGLRDLDATTLSTVYGAALGYASGLTVGSRRS